MDANGGLIGMDTEETPITLHNEYMQRDYEDDPGVLVSHF